MSQAWYGSDTSVGRQITQLCRLHIPTSPDKTREHAESCRSVCLLKYSSEPSLTRNRMKKRLNVDSPSFTPSSTLAPNGGTSTPKSSGLSPRAASAAPFKPKSVTPSGWKNHSEELQLSGETASSVASFSGSSTSKPYNPNAPDWIGGETQEFLPQSFNNLSVSCTQHLYSLSSLLCRSKISVSTIFESQYIFVYLLHNIFLD